MAGFDEHTRMAVERDTNSEAGSDRVQDALGNLAVRIAPRPALGVGVLERGGRRIEATQPLPGCGIRKYVEELLCAADAVDSLERGLSDEPNSRTDDNERAAPGFDARASPAGRYREPFFFFADFLERVADCLADCVPDRAAKPIGGPI
jgi:hypothetical protein